MKRTLTPLLTATILSLTFVGAAIAKPPFGTNKPHHCVKADMKGHKSMDMKHPHKPFFLKGIELTSEQEDKIFALTHAEVPEMRTRMKAQRELRQDLMILIQSNKFDENKARKIADKLANIERENALSKARLDNSIMNLLTPEQREQVSKNKKQMRYGQARPMPTAFYNESLQSIAI
jgi:Spy/CpxP family protein refolding chaperone